MWLMDSGSRQCDTFHPFLLPFVQILNINYTLEDTFSFLDKSAQKKTSGDHFSTSWARLFIPVFKQSFRDDTADNYDNDTSTVITVIIIRRGAEPKCVSKTERYAVGEKWSGAEPRRRQDGWGLLKPG